MQERGGTHSDLRSFRWECSGPLKIFLFSMIVAAWLGALAWPATCVVRGTPINPVVVPLAMFAAFLSAAALASTRWVRADDSGIIVRRWGGATRRIERDEILGVEPDLPWNRWVRVRTVDRPCVIHTTDMGQDRAKVHAELTALYGRVAVHPALEPGSELMQAIRERIERGEVLEWRHRTASAVTIVGLVCMVLILLLAAMTPWWLAWLVNLPRGSGLLALPWTYLVMFMAALAMLTVMDLVRGGPIVALRADSTGIELVRWWRSVRFDASEFAVYPLGGEKILGAEMVGRHGWPRPWRYVMSERRWRCQPYELVTVLTFVSGHEPGPAAHLGLPPA